MLATDDKVKEGSVPAYTGETPAKHHDTAGYYYAFSGWSPEVVEATEDTSYTAQFTECTNEPVNYVNAKGEAQPAITEYIPKNGEPDTKDILVKDAEIKDVGGKTYYVFKCNVAAKEIDSEITAQIVDGDRSGELYTYSVREYADYLLSHLEVEEFAKAADLVRALITYGENAEYIFDKTDDEPAQVNTVIPEYDHTIHTLPSDVTFLGATLSLKSQTSLSLYFESEREIELSCDGQTTETAHSGKQYVIRIRNIPAAELNTYFTIKVDGEAAVTYSPLTYCYNAQSSEDTKLVNTVKALYLYWDAAEHYFNSSEYIGSEEDETGKS